MSLLILIIALLCERTLTQLLRLREPRWLDRYCDAVCRGLAAAPVSAQPVLAACATLLPVLPVALVVWRLGSWLQGLPQFAVATFVLLCSFGPRDLKAEVDDYVDALVNGPQSRADQRAKEILESDAAGRSGGVRQAVEEAIFVQANNRVFGVMFWFLLLGPAGAWMFRVSDMLRRRAAFESLRATQSDAAMPAAVLAQLHGLLAWLPARLAAISYAIGGSFEDAIGNWKDAADRTGTALLERSEQLLARVGSAALQPSLAAVMPAELELATVRGAWRIVGRAIWVWLAVVAVLVLIGRLS
jgi:membrane protein required for beta-lactamase induction